MATKDLSVPATGERHYYVSSTGVGDQRSLCLQAGATWAMDVPCLDGDGLECFTGPPEARFVGACRDGVQGCVNRQWTGPCVGEVLPTTEVCAGDGVDEDCDGVVDEGWSQPGPALCETDGIVFPPLSGDTGASMISTVGRGDAWYRADFTEDDSGLFGRDITGRITLASPPGANYDLDVFCMTCGGDLIQSSKNGAGMHDEVIVWTWDLWGVNQPFQVWIHIYRVDPGICAEWMLSVEGNTGKGDTNNPTCFF